MNKPSQPFDFERTWQKKFTRALDTALDPHTRDAVLEGADKLTQDSPALEKINWTCQALETLSKAGDENTCREILIQCACQYPIENLQDTKGLYQSTGNIDLVIQNLQAKFETFLRDNLDLEEELVGRIVSQGWGLAGIRQGDRIIAIKIPKSGYIRDYFSETDPLEKRRYYCHCPRVREGVGREPQLPPVYCYCGAGFYKGIWEEILGKPVEVEVLESVLAGDEVCRIVIHVPE